MNTSLLAQVRIVLVEPAGPLNVGAIARVMKNMGLQQLILVNPVCEPLSTEAQRMAVHARDVLNNARQVKTLPDALQGCQRIAATTGRDDLSSHHPFLTITSPQEGLSWLLGYPSALIFGREDRGLTNIELNYAQRLVRIPTSSEYLSLNLAQAVGICCYELYQGSQQGSQSRQQHSPEHIPAQSSKLDPAIESIAHFESLEAYYQHLETVLLKIGYLYPHTAPSRMAKFRQVFNRSQLTEGEVALLRGILSQVEWALTAKSPSSGSILGKETGKGSQEINDRTG